MAARCRSQERRWSGGGGTAASVIAPRQKVAKEAVLLTENLASAQMKAGEEVIGAELFCLLDSKALEAAAVVAAAMHRLQCCAAAEVLQQELKLLDAGMCCTGQGQAHVNNVLHFSFR